MKKSIDGVWRYKSCHLFYRWILLGMCHLLSFSCYSNGELPDVLTWPQKLNPSFDFYSLNYDGLRGQVKSITIYRGKIERNFGKESLIKSYVIDSIVYSPYKFRKERFSLGDFGESRGSAKHGEYYFYMGNERIDSILSYDDVEDMRYGYNPESKIVFSYVGNDSIVETLYEEGFPDRFFVPKTQTQYKLLPNGYRSYYYADKEADAEKTSFIVDGTTGKAIFPFIWPYLNAGGLEKQIIFEADDKGRIIKIAPPERREDNSKRSSFNAYCFDYDQFGNMVKLSRMRYDLNDKNRYVISDKKEILVEYEYDGEGNWVKATITTEEDNGIRVDRNTLYYFRDIEYYTEGENDK